MTLFLSYLINGISLGSVYAIIALGYTMVYGIAKMLNFAHGDVIMVGAYVSFCAMQYLGLPKLVSVVLAMVVCTALGIVIEGLAYKPLRQAPSLAVLITAIGVSYFLVRILGKYAGAWLGCRLVKKHPSVQIDLNSIAQGATADYVARWLDSLGWKDYLVEVGGEIFARGHNAKGGLWRVGIDKPIEGNVIPGAQLQVRIGISNRGLATSGNYRKFYTDSLGRKIVHTFDARTGAPVISNLLSATVVARTAAQADAYGTLCMVMGLNESIRFLESRPDLEAYLVWSDDRGNYRTYMTPGMESLVLQ